MQNSWVLPVENKSGTKYNHHFFCKCGHSHTITTQINELYPPKYICEQCGNNVFINTIDFKDMAYDNIFDIFKWEINQIETISSWQIVYSYKIPQFIQSTNTIKFTDKRLLSIKLEKDGTGIIECKIDKQFQNQYYKNEDKKLTKLFQKEPRELLYKFVMNNKTNAIQWIYANLLASYSRGKRLEILSFFLKLAYLKEFEFFKWELSTFIADDTKLYPTQIEMLNYISNKAKSKIVKKTIYEQYERSLKETDTYNPMFDYIFSRTIDNIDLLVQLYKIEPQYKNKLFLSIWFDIKETILFIRFLKQHYTQKKIVTFFIDSIQLNTNYWGDTIGMLSRQNSFYILDKYFAKVKLTPKNIHDEVVRVSHLASYSLANSEEFEYSKEELDLCKYYENLEFRLPKTVYQLDFWSKLLHNCMFGYSNMIHNKQTIIYGVFKNDTLVYAVEIKNNKIVQEKAMWN